MQVNSVNSNQSFGSVKISDSAMSILKKRIVKQSEIEKLGKLVEAQKKNNIFDVFVEARNANDIYGYVGDGATYCQNFEERFFARLFSSPVKFIENMCKDADKQLKRHNFVSQLDNLV